MALCKVVTAAALLVHLCSLVTSSVKIGVITGDGLSEMVARAAFEDYKLETTLNDPDAVELVTKTLPQGILTQEQLNFTINEALNIEQTCQATVISIQSEMSPLTPILDSGTIPQIIPTYSKIPSLSTLYTTSMLGESVDDAQALADFLSIFRWSTVAVITSKQTDLTGFLLRSLKAGINLEQIYQIESNEHMDAVLQAILSGQERVFYVILPGVTARVLFDKANLIGLMDEGWAWIVDDSVLLQPGLLNQCETEPPVHLRGLLALRRVGASGEKYQEFKLDWEIMFKLFCNQTNRVLELPSSHFSLAMMPYGHVYDATKILLESLSATDPGQSKHEHALAILEAANQKLMRNGKGKVFDYRGEVDEECDYQVLNLIRDGWTEIGCWHAVQPLNSTRITLNRSAALFPGTSYIQPLNLQETLRDKKLKIVTILEAPFVSSVEDDDGNKQLVGLCVDMLNEIADNLGFTYELYPVADNQYGILDEITGRWNGMIGELIDEKADLAVGPLTISYERQQAVQFTKPYMEYGATILMKKGFTTHSLFSFLEPFERDLWLAVVATIIAAGIFVYVLSWSTRKAATLARGSNSTAPTAKVPKDENLANSFWFVWAAQMDQGAEWIPNALSARVVAGAFWFVAYVLSASYTANLTAFLTVTRLSGDIRSVSDLADQNNIAYGTVSGSQLYSFFKNQDVQLYKRMYLTMEERQTFVPNTSVGVAKVRNDAEPYAYMFDNTILEYIASNEPCDTMTVGDTFNKAGYGIALRPGVKYTNTLSLEILRLRQEGLVEKLQEQWIIGSCPKSGNTQASSGKLSLKNMTGIFLVFAFGVGLALIVLLIHALWIKLGCSKKSGNITPKHFTKERPPSVTINGRRPTDPNVEPNEDFELMYKDTFSS